MKKIVVTLVTTSLLFGCIDSKDDCDNGLIPVALTSKVVVSERSSQQDIQLVKDQEISLFVTEAWDMLSTIYENVRLTADGNGFFSTQGLELFYPLEPKNVDFYAVHPYQEGLTTASSSFTFMVQKDQTIRKSYYDSDLLYGRLNDVEKTRLPVPIVFDHKLSKLTFVVKQGPGIDLSGLTSIQVMNVLNGVDMDIYYGFLFEKNEPVTEIEVFGVRGTTGGETEVSGMAAIVIPQPFSADGVMPLFKVDINNISYYYIPKEEDYIRFESGKVYNYILTISSTGIQVSSSINDWLPGGDIEEEIT